MFIVKAKSSVFKRQKGFVHIFIPIVVLGVVLIGGSLFFIRKKISTREAPISLPEVSETERHQGPLMDKEDSPVPIKNYVDISSTPTPTVPVLRRISVSGYAYEDRSNDGLYNSDDPKLPNMQFYLIDTFNSQQISTVFTDSNGNFSISLKVRGSLLIRPTAYNNFVPKTGDKTINTSTSGLEFRFRSASAPVPAQNIGIIEGNVYQDSNKNKTRDPGEASVRFYKLYLVSGGNYYNTVENAQSTDAGGHFKFINLPVPGTYTLKLSNPTGEYEILQPETTINLTQVNFQDTNIEIPVFKR